MNTIRPTAKCEIDGCTGVAAAMNAARYPRCTLVLQMTAAAEALRQAATELDDLAGSLPAYELGTARRKAAGVVAAAFAFAQGTVLE